MSGTCGKDINRLINKIFKTNKRQANSKPWKAIWSNKKNGQSGMAEVPARDEQKRRLENENQR